MSEPRCYVCGYLLGHIDDACPRCLPGFGHDDDVRQWQKLYLKAVEAQRSLSSQLDACKARVGPDFVPTIQMVGMGNGKPRVVELTFKTQDAAVAFAGWLFDAIQIAALAPAGKGE